MKETIEFVRIVDGLARLYPRLMMMAATEAVNFSKERFVQQNWIGTTTQPWKKRKNNVDPGRAILVKRAVLKRDVQKRYVGETKALIGTSRITAGYAKAHNEGFRGTVTVNAHTRKRYVKVKEKYTTKKGNTRTRTSKQVEAGSKDIQVGTFRRRVNLAKRQYLGPSPVLDKRIERMIAAQIIKSIKQNSSR